MRRRELSLFALVSGALFTGIGVLCLTAGMTGRGVDTLWVIPALLVGLGVAGLAQATRRRR